MPEQRPPPLRIIFDCKLCGTRATCSPERRRELGLAIVHRCTDGRFGIVEAIGFTKSDSIINDQQDQQFGIA